MSKRPWCCPEPKCTPVFQLKDSDYEDITMPVTGESFFCFGMMERPVAFTYDGVQHNNDLNSCSYTALKGVIRFQENEADWEALEIAYRRARQKVRDIRAAAPAERTRVEGERWTKEAPVVDGVYWWRADSRDSEPDIHRVVGGIFFEVGEQFSRVVEGFGGEWLGPITPATLPTSKTSAKDTCPQCSGSGFETDSVTPCEFCGGDGWVFQRDVEAYEQGHADGHREATDFCLRVADSTSSDSARRAAEAQNRDKAQEIILATEAALEEKFDSVARHELVNRITAALTAAAPADNDAESVVLAISTCGECPFVDHSGAFTPGGAKAICGHRNAIDTFAATVEGNDRHHWKYRQVNRQAAPPAQCPLRTTTTKQDH